MISHLELFAGIGGFRQAIDLIGKDNLIDTRCVGFSEIDKYASSTYKANYDTKNEIEIGDIVNFTSDISKIKGLEDFELLTGGFPCQSFSMMGKQRGFDDHRGNLFYRIIDILNIKKPPFLLLENVKNLQTHDQGKTFQEIIKTLKKTGYKEIYSDIFNTANFSLAQKRNRIFIFAARQELPKSFSFSEESVIETFKTLDNTSLLKQKNVLDVLDINTDDKYYLSEKIKPTILANGSKNFVSKSEINQIIARPLTATMVKMHRACQDNYYSDNFLRSSDPVNYNTYEYSKDEIALHRIRKLTPKEALKLQGFNSQFHDKAKEFGLSDHQLYKQAGNAVSVNTAYAILHHLIIRNNILKLL